MSILERIERAISQWLHDRALERTLRRWGGCQVCPWCKQWVQLHDGWYFDSATDPTIDALHCGNCGGVSRWRFELGMMPLDPIGLAPPSVKCAVPAAKPSWRCFHCDEVFTSEHCARLHFGPDELHYPACQIKGSEGGLLRALREAEAGLMQANHDAHNEAGPVLRAWRDAIHRHHQALIAMEETGYERGVADMRAQMAGGLEILKILAEWQTSEEAKATPVTLSEPLKDRLNGMGERLAQRNKTILDARQFLALYQEPSA